MQQPIIGRYAAPPRPIARRMSDLNPYARLERVQPATWDRVVGRVCAVGVVVIVALLAMGVLE
jgi:hypothetical protein